MPNAMIFDAVRTPRGKGKKDGSLHQVTPVNLLAQLLQENFKIGPATRWGNMETKQEKSTKLDIASASPR